MKTYDNCPSSHDPEFTDDLSMRYTDVDSQEGK